MRTEMDEPDPEAQQQQRHDGEQRLDPVHDGAPGPQLLNGAKPRHDVDGRVHYPGHREGDDHNSDVKEQNDTEQGDLHLDPPPVQG